jgi:hypothetical protein
VIGIFGSGRVQGKMAGYFIGAAFDGNSIVALPFAVISPR